LALREEDFETAALLRDELAAADFSRPALALEGLLRDRVRLAVDTVLGRGIVASLGEQIKAVKLLQALATPPAASRAAEDGLFCVLQQSTEDELLEVAEAALWSCWLPSGDEVVDVAMRQGLRFMGAGELSKAVQAFTEVVSRAPTYAEGWNKRATALFLAERFNESIEDCARVLALNPRHFGCLSGLGICHLRKGDERSAIHWLRRACEVNPRSEDSKRIVADLEARSAFALLQPRINEVLSQLRAEVPSGPPKEVQQVRASWDAHRVQDLDKYTYYFRVSVECLSGPGVVGAARYYALKHSGGSVFPLSRVTKGPASFKLAPGESYFYSFMLTLKEELRSAQGGLLLRGRGGCGKNDDLQGEIFEAPLERLEELNRHGAVREADLGRLNEGYRFMGRLEIEVED
jgi:tetratricopeptide (TPR) repeat protein